MFFINISNTIAVSADLSMMSEEELSDLEKQLTDQFLGDGLSLGRCIYKGNIDFILFLQTLIYSDGFVEGVFEPFRDIFSRNQCQSSDVMNLIKQRDKIRDSIRDSFLSCRNERIPLLRRAYTLVNAEIFYVRHVVEGVLSLALPFDLLNTLMLQSDESLYSNDDELYKTMKERYVSEILPEDDFDVFYKGLRAQYSERKKQYLSCENGSFKSVAEKFNEFIDDLGGFSSALDESQKRIAGRAEKIWEAISDPGLLDYLSGVVNININKVSPQQSGEDFLEYLAEFGQFPSYQRSTYDALLSEVGSEEMRYLLSTKKAEISSTFSYLYRDNSDQSIKKYLDELKDLNTTLLNSLDDMDKVYECAFSMNLRQCPNK